MQTKKSLLSLSLFVFLFLSEIALSQSVDRPEFPSGQLTEPLDFDGALNEADWKNAPILTNLKTTVPVEGGEPSQTTLI